MLVNGYTNSFRKSHSPNSPHDQSRPKTAPSLPSIDYVLVYATSDHAKAGRRRMFEEAMRATGLVLDKLHWKDKTFVQVYCPFKRMALEAEAVKLEMPLRGCPIIGPDESLFDRIFRRLKTDDEVDYVSAPFIYEKLHLYEGVDKPDQFFRSAARSLLVHHILINLDASSGADDQAREGLYAMLMFGAYKDAFILHDQSAEDPHYEKLRTRLPAVHSVVMERLTTYTDTRKELSDHWTTCTKFQPLWRIRYYFGEEIAFYFAWLGTYVTTLWFPAICGLIHIGFGLYKAIEVQRNSICVCKNAPNDNTSTTTVFVSTSTIQSVELQEQCREDIPMLQVATQKFYYIIRDAFNNEFNPFYSFIICMWGVANQGVGSVGISIIRKSGCLYVLCSENRSLFINDSNDWQAMEWYLPSTLAVTYYEKGMIFLELWKRRQSTLAYEWDVSNYEETEPDRPSFRGTTMRVDPVSKETLWIYPEHRRMKRFLVSTFVIVVMMCCVFLTIAGVIALKVYLRVALDCPSDTDNLEDEKGCVSSRTGDTATCVVLVSLVPAAVSALSVLFWEWIYEKIIARLSEWENYQTDTDYKNAYILKLFMFQFVNSYSMLFYIVLFRPQDHKFQSDGVFNLGPEYKDTCEKGCLPLLALQVLLLMIVKPIAKFCRDVVIPWIWGQIKISRRLMNHVCRTGMREAWNNRRRSSTLFNDVRENYIVREYHKPQLIDFTLGEFSEKIIQFGYIVMFAVAFPLAPFVALIVNNFDMRIDARRLLWFNRRPVPCSACDIGTWFPILRLINFCGIVSNSLIIMSTSVLAEGKNKEERYFMMIMFEHVLFALVFLIDVLIPDTPSSIRQAMRREKRQVSKILELGSLPSLPGASSRDPNPTSSAQEKDIMEHLGLVPRGHSGRTRPANTLLSRPPSCRSLVEYNVYRELNLVPSRSGFASAEPTVVNGLAGVRDLVQTIMRSRAVSPINWNEQKSSVVSVINNNSQLTVSSVGQTLTTHDEKDEHVLPGVST